MTLNFKEHLETQAAAAARKGDRTRIRLRIATVEMLDAVGYHRMRISDIAEAAGITPGSLYQYYTDKRQITLSLLDEFEAFFAARQNEKFAGEPVDAYEAIRRSNLRYLQIVRQNPGVMRCILQVADDEPEFARRFYASSRKQNERVAAGLLRRLGAPRARLPEITVRVYALAAMMDEVARRLLVQQDPELRGVVDAVDLDVESLAAVLSDIWYRALYDGPQAGARAPARSARAASPRRRRARS